MNYLFIIPYVGGRINLIPGIAYVAASLKNHSVNVFGLDLQYFKPVQQYDALKEKIIEDNIDVICIGALSTQYNSVKKIIAWAREIKPDIMAVLGGGLVTTEPEVVIGNIGANFGIVGQGEITICELHDALIGNKKFDCIDGLVYFDDDNKICTNKLRAEIEELDALEFYPLYEIFNIDKYVERYESIDITASRSCPFNCTFCYHPSGSKYRKRSISNIMKEIDYWTGKYSKIKIVNMIDELFAADQGRMYEFCDKIKDYNLDYWIQLRAPDVTEDILSKLKKSGCTSITYGIESADNRILKSMRKRITIEQVENAIDLTLKAGIGVRGNLIFGDLEEDEESVFKSMLWWRKYAYLGIAMSKIWVLPGSHLYNVAIERGIIKDRLKYLENGDFTINVSKLTEEQYYGIDEQINWLKKGFSRQAIDLKIERMHSDGTCDVFLRCETCNAVNRYKNVNLLGEDMAPDVCNICKKRFYLEPTSILSTTLTLKVIEPYIENVLKPYAEKNSKIVIWGSGDRTDILLMASKSLRECTKFIVDNNINKHGKKKFGEYLICSKEELLKQDVDYIILSTTARNYAKIKDIIKNELGLNIPIIDLSNNSIETYDD